MKIIVCNDCFAHINFTKIKNELIPDNKSNPNYYYYDDNKMYKYTKCVICNRFIHDIINNPEIIDLMITKLNQDITLENLFYLISRYSKLNYHNNIYYLQYELNDIFNFNANSIKNFFKVIKNLNDIPTANIINEKIIYIFNHKKN